MSLVDERRCDGCGDLRKAADGEWYALIPPGPLGEDKRLDFCAPECLAKFVRSRYFQSWAEDSA